MDSNIDLKPAPQNDFSSAVGRRRGTAFAATFAGVFLLGSLVLAIEFLEVWQTPVNIPQPTPRQELERIEQQSARAAALKTAALQTAALQTASLQKARDLVAESRREADRAELAVFEFLNARYVEATQIATLQSLQARREAKAARPAPTPAPRPNPEWAALNDQLTRLERQRSDLLQRMTPAHPAVQALDAQISGVRDQLAATPVNLPPALPEHPAAAVAQSETATDPEQPPEAIVQNPLGVPSSELEQTYRKLLLAAGKARDSYRSAAAAENAVWLDCQQSQAARIAANKAGAIDLRPNDRGPLQVAEQARARRDRSFPIGATAILTLLSLLAGAAAARRVDAQTLTYASAEEIETALGLPVLGRIGGDSVRSNAA